MTHTVGHFSASKKINRILFALFMFMTFVFISGCEKNADTYPELSDIDSVISMLGMDKDDVSNKFGTETVNIEYADILRLDKKLRLDGVDVSVDFEFENQKLFRINYDFDSCTDRAISFAQKLNSEMTSKYGESDTYESLPNRVSALTVDLYLNDDQLDYKEYWIGKGIALDGIFLDENNDKKRTDLGIGIRKIPENPVRTIVYIGGIVNNAGTLPIN